MSHTPNIAAIVLDQAAKALDQGRPHGIEQADLTRNWAACNDHRPMIEVLLYHQGLRVQATALRIAMRHGEPSDLANIVRGMFPAVEASDLVPRAPSACAAP